MTTPPSLPSSSSPSLPRSAPPDLAPSLPPGLARVLAEPPRAYSPAAIWWWSGEPLRRDRLRRQLERFAEGGVWNLVILNLAPSGPMFGSDADDPPFFSEAWWTLLEQVCDDAEELGISLWFYDQLGFSGADLQARLVDEEPRFAGRWLAPDGSVTTRGFDYLSRKACAALIDRVHGEFERRLGHRLGGVIAGSFQDELPSIPTWSDGFAQEFARRRGYDLTPHLPLLWREGGKGPDADPRRDGADGPDAGRVRRDYHRTRAELAEEAFFRPLAAWHERHGLVSGCDQQDPARAGHPVEGVQLYADYARTHRWFGAPGSDHHGDARIHSSLAHLYGRPRTWIEAFHSSGWGGTLEETFDWLLPWLRAGATLYNPHAVYYTTKGGWWEWAPPATDWRQPYWRHHRVFADAVTRLCAALSLGRHACEVAVLLPTATAQAFTGLDGAGPEAGRAQEVYRRLVGDMAWFRMVPGVLDELGLDADVIDDDSIQRATVRPSATGVRSGAEAGGGAGVEIGGGARLEVAGESYAAVVLPACAVLEPDTERALIAFAERGGLVVAVETLPGGP
ncbi:glycosyl hydrolase, partial [Nonomuraea sp. NPDC050691]|uniref:glycosyl hydrolase n=1 Tax=Nonomuraea sp. NPDC050691 TaxID=3155661 RepID=UPI0033C4DC3E